MAMTALRTTRELVTPEDMPRTRMICSRPRPASDMIVSSNSSPGIDIHASTKRCTTRSNLPPRNPAVPPISAATAACQRGRRQPDEQRDARAVDQAAQEVAAELVGAERMLARWIGETVVQVDLGETKRRQRVGKDAHQDQHQQDESAERTQRVLSDQSHGPHGYA